MQLAQIAHMDFGGVAGVLGALDIIEPAADELVGLVHRAVEQHVVIGHVEMAVVVDPAGLDRHRRGDKGREERGFEIETIEHFQNVTDSTRATQAKAESAQFKFWQSG